MHLVDIVVLLVERVYKACSSSLLVRIHWWTNWAANHQEAESLYLPTEICYPRNMVFNWFQYMRRGSSTKLAFSTNALKLYSNQMINELPGGHWFFKSSHMNWTQIDPSLKPNPIFKGGRLFNTSVFSNNWKRKRLTWMRSLWAKECICRRIWSNQIFLKITFARSNDGVCIYEFVRDKWVCLIQCKQVILVTHKLIYRARINVNEGQYTLEIVHDQLCTVMNYVMLQILMGFI